MISIFLLWRTDAQHSHSSKFLIAVCKDKLTATQLALEYDDTLIDGDIEFLLAKGQTQRQELNYIIERKPINKLLS